MNKKCFCTILVTFIFFANMPIVSADDPQHRIKAIADKYGLTGKGVSIAILDTGYSGSNINIIKKYNVVYEGDDIEDKNGHGSLTANIIGSKDFGIAPEAELYIIKVMEKNISGKYDAVIKGIEKAIRYDVDIILMSLGGTKYSEKMESIIKKALEKDIVLISAVGNDGLSQKDTIRYPAKLDGVIGVGAVNQSGRRWFQSSKGRGIDIMAPGENLKSVDQNKNETRISGTSVAAAYLAGFLSLMLQEKKNITNEQIVNMLSNYSKKEKDVISYGKGVLNEKETLKHLRRANIYSIVLKTGIILFVLLIMYFLIYKFKGKRRFSY
ncbi:S8 family serine peptidase [Bacillus altitudinis]|uniref:S8 family serine peptidase n=1 Tax=Bacillus altitudinis TaxID=293387 RepID=UPI003F7C7F1C